MGETGEDIQARYYKLPSCQRLLAFRAELFHNLEAIRRAARRLNPRNTAATPRMANLHELWAKAIDNTFKLISSWPLFEAKEDAFHNCSDDLLDNLLMCTCRDLVSPLTSLKGISGLLHRTLAEDQSAISAEDRAQVAGASEISAQTLSLVRALANVLPKNTS